MPSTIEIDFGGISKDNIQQLKLINTTCFPISYAPGFYRDVVDAKNSEFNKFAYHNGIIIGAICCRIQDAKASNGSSELVRNGKVLYIMTLAVLPAYRGRGVGQKLLKSVLNHVESAKLKDTESIEDVILHVHISNDDGIKFYIEKMGFEKGELVENYYNRIDPPHAYILRKHL